MTTAPIDEAETIRRALGAAARIATLPQVAARVIELVEDPSSQNSEIERVIEADPVLAAKILKVANSPMYGFTQTVASVRRAIDMLGHEATRNVTIAVSMAKLFQGGTIAPGYRTEGLWHHANAVAVVSRMVATRALLSPEETYLAGLLHKIGILLELLVNRAALKDAFLQAATQPQVSLREAERARFGTDHAALGAALCRAWKLPEAVCEAVAHHHAEAPPSSTAAAVYLGRHLVANDPAGFTLERLPPQVPATVLEPLAFTDFDVDRLAADVAQTVTSAPWEEK